MDIVIDVELPSQRHALASSGGVTSEAGGYTRLDMECDP